MARERKEREYLSALLAMVREGAHTLDEVAGQFGISRRTLSRILDQHEQDTGEILQSSRINGMTTCCPKCRQERDATDYWYQGFHHTICLYCAEETYNSRLRKLRLHGRTIIGRKYRYDDPKDH